MTIACSSVDDTVLLSTTEQRSLALRLSLALTAGGALIISLGWGLIYPDQEDVAQLIAGVAAVLIGVPALKAAWSSLQHPDLHGITDQLVALAFLAAWASGDLVTATLLPLIMMVGHILEERSLLGSQEAIRALSRLTESNARRLNKDGRVEDVGAHLLRVGDVIEVRAGDRVPADGVVVFGNSSVDTASITGESLPADISVGGAVFSGSINLDGLLHVRVERVGRETTLGRVIALMQEAETIKPAVTRLLERYAGGYMAFVLLLTASLWLLTDSAPAALAVLVASCPCALVLAAPATSIAAIAVASRHGILVKGTAFLEQLANVDAVILDKTGTLTTGELRIVSTAVVDGVTEDRLLELAGSLGVASSHPVSRAIARDTDNARRLDISDFRETRGLGMVGHFQGETVALGRAALFAGLDVAVPPPPAGHLGPVVGVSKGACFWGWVLLEDKIRPEAPVALQDLRSLGLTQQLMVTGDRTSEAKRVADALAIGDLQAEALPNEKMAFVIDMTRRGFRPMVVGDGINDALALKVGSVGIAMGAQGADVALASSDLVLMTNDLRRLGTCVRLSRHCRRTILANVGMGIGWTVVVIGIAATGFFGTSGALIAALLHNAGTLAVMANAGRLLRYQEH